MKNKIASLSKSDDFRSILNGEKLANRYFTIFFTKLAKKKEELFKYKYCGKKKTWHSS